VGASGSIMAIFSALAFYRPNLTVNLFGIFPIRLIFLAGIFILSDLISLGLDDKTAHFAHIGGVIIGLLSIKNLHSKTNIVTGFQRFIESIGGFFSGLFKPKSKLTVKKGGATNARFKTDEEFIVEAKLRQQKIDAILDKISKSGYESLTKAEKDFLFQQSKNG
jgi:predicted DNA-binding antitoxin AbrB/MazE fold protein